MCSPYSVALIVRSTEYVDLIVKQYSVEVVADTGAWSGTLELSEPGGFC